MYLKRKIDLYLNDWFLDKERKPLIVKGSRQIGKTESIRHFASSHYKYYVEINFALERKYLNICSEGYDVDSIIKSITLIDNTKIFVNSGIGTKIIKARLFNKPTINIYRIYTK